MATGDKIILSEDSNVTVVDNLTSTSTTNALSANQGRVLNNEVSPKIEADDYASSTVGGTVKARLNGDTLYITIDGSDA